MEQPGRRSPWTWWQRTPLYLRIVAGMALGVAVGLALGARAEVLAIPSRLVLRLLGGLAPGLILFAIIKALYEAHFEPGTTGKLMRLLAINTLVAICIGLLVANVLRPGGRAGDLASHGVSAVAHRPSGQDAVQQFLENVPRSLLGPWTDNGNVLGVIFWALAFGVALRRSRSRVASTVKELVDLGLEALVVILHWVIELVPIAVFGLVAGIVGTKGFGPFRALAAFIAAVLVGLILQASYYLLRVRLGSWVRPFTLLRECRDALLMAFSTGSSTVTMPLTFESLHERVGLRERSASLGALVGSNFNNDGTALYEAMAALFISQLLAAQGLGNELSLAHQLQVIVMSVVASVGAAGIPEAGLVTMTMVFQAVNLPTEYIALLLPVDWFLDRCRTVINVMGDMNVSCLVDGKQRETATERTPTLTQPNPDPSL